MKDSENTNIKGDNNEVEIIECSTDLLNSLMKMVVEKDKQINRVITLLESKDDQVAQILKRMDRLLDVLEAHKK
ncbi:MAG: hypothetical protein SNG27_07620 [Rikenellaceae bacterium]